MHRLANPAAASTLRQPLIPRHAPPPPPPHPRYLDQLAAGGAEHTLRDDGLGFAGEGAFGFGGLEGDYGGPFGGGYAEGAAEGELGAGPRGEGAFQRQLRERRSAEQALSGSEEEADVETER